MDGLTKRQAEVLRVVRQSLSDFGYPPTRAEIAQVLGFKSANASEEHLRALARKGAIEMVPGTSRGIRLPEPDGLPLVGRVAAGAPILAVEHIEERVQLPPGFFRPEAHFLLRIKGDSMTDAGILDGDLLAVHNAATARNGQIVVARINDAVTVKRLSRPNRRSRHLQLLPENDAHDPIDVDLRQDDFAIEGLCVGVLRRSP
ncbi:MAG: transcriptional repressor LexA [Gammaproteobacteria bacterium]|nr:transcriptional repressor LexA [Gammaproteobacteria bacterium]